MLIGFGKELVILASSNCNNPDIVAQPGVTNNDKRPEEISRMSGIQADMQPCEAAPSDEK